MKVLELRPTSALWHRHTLHFYNCKHTHTGIFTTCPYCWVFMAASLLAIVADTTPWNKKNANSAQTPYYDMLRHSLEWACLSIIFFLPMKVRLCVWQRIQLVSCRWGASIAGCYDKAVCSLISILGKGLFLFIAHLTTVHPLCRKYSERRIRDAFRENKFLTDPQQIHKQYTHGLEQLQMLHRQVCIWLYVCIENKVFFFFI